MASLARWFGKSNTQDESLFGYCVVGTGHGAEKMCEALAHSPHARVAAVMSSSVERARKFAKRYGISRAYSYDQFAELQQDKTVDAVYLALPVAPHRSFTEKAIAAGKHVLCEKPMAASASDAEAMISAARTAGKLLMIAYRLDYDPVHAEVARLLSENALGTIRKVTSDFGIVAKPGWRFEPALAGGGSLFDVGVYPIHAIWNFFGDATTTRARIVQNGATGMELDASWEGTLSNGAAFACRSSYLQRFPDVLRIEGEGGWLQLDHAFAYERTELSGEVRDATGKTRKLSLRDAKSNASLFRLEAEHLAACVRTGMGLKSSGEDGLRDMRTILTIEAIAERTSR